MENDKRRKLIQLLINKKKISTQQELIEQLKENGVEVTQATISRDIRSLNIVKKRDDKGLIYYAQAQVSKENMIWKFYETVEQYVYNVQRIEYINVIHTVPNFANVLTALLDSLEIPEVTGSVAGYDTIMIISSSIDDAMVVEKLFEDHIDASLK
ncbi:arginine repressor [Liquorilactobacillus vini]|uniref:Arginine repressor n=1 Tax=Liquorilactobacillus vini DSM 20605 TaxID=1133569 RepID=A0A0R2CKG6_9LACO|nr:arginine repressor ArgR [Liquorilactobacillus vini]KRM89033.1 hypothetical protein FD21_GL000400 [Liquorilactobacillus vini DSM 20605]